MRRLFHFAAVLVLAAGTGLVLAQAPARKASPREAPPRVSMPPIPNPGFPPGGPVDVTRAVYEFAAQHPEVLKYVPCYCGCESSGHPHNESCFVRARDAKGNVTAWDTHGYG